MLLLYNEFVVQGHFPFIVFFCSNSLYIGKTCTAFFYSIKHNVSVLKLKSCKVVYRKQKHYNQEKLAELLDVSVATVSRIENGSSAMDILILMNISKILEQPIDNIISLEKD